MDRARDDSRWSRAAFALFCVLCAASVTRSARAEDLGPTMQIGGEHGADAGADTRVDAGADAGADAATDATPEAGASAEPDATTPAPEWAPKLRATVKPASAHLGDPIEVRIVLTHRPGVSVTLPLRLELGEFSELSRDESRRETGPEGHLPTIEQTYTLRVAAYKLGKLTLPPIEINALGPAGELVTLQTTAFPLEIASVMANEPTPKPKGADPAVRVFRRTWWLLYTIAGVAALGLIVLITVLVQRRLQARRRAAKPPPPPIPPHVLALERLDQLDVEGLLAAADFKQLYLQLSEILREYIGRLWHFDALEMTSTEIATKLMAGQVRGELRERLLASFSAWDLVKFAKYQPDPASAREAVDEARTFVHDTRALAALEPPAATAIAAGRDETGSADASPTGGEPS